MSNILVVNCGSASIKISVFQSNLDLLLNFHLKGLYSNKAVLEIVSKDDTKNLSLGKDIGITEGIFTIINLLCDEYKIETPSIKVIGHRFVHGGTRFLSNTLIDRDVLIELEKLGSLAPLHNDASLEGITACLDYFGELIPQLAVFDTTFFQSMPPIASQYALSKKLTSKYPIKRFGFHGISHAYLWNAFQKIDKEHTDSKIVTLHLGSGCSIAAIRGGMPLDNSMGFSPSEGLIMSTRAGDIDSAVMEFLVVHAQMTPTEVMQIYNEQSGLLGISEISSNMQELQELYEKDERAKLAIDMFCYRALKGLGAFISALEGADAIIFSGGIGENSPIVREKIIQGVGWQGVKIDRKVNARTKNLKAGDVKLISLQSSSIKIYVIATDENHLIAEEASKLKS